jgi:hypothetical protein
MKQKLLATHTLGMPVDSDLYKHLVELFNRLTLHHQDVAFD